MATRSAIAVTHGTVVKGVYCHWDGYIDHNGVILQEHYDSAKANHLVALGDVSSLQPEIGEKHAFSQIGSGLTQEEYESRYGNMTTFYGRDRNMAVAGNDLTKSLLVNLFCKTLNFRRQS